MAAAMAVARVSAHRTTRTHTDFFRGFTKARTGGELLKSCEVSHETMPRLTPNPSLAEVHLFLSHIFNSSKYRNFCFESINIDDVYFWKINIF